MNTQRASSEHPSHEDTLNSQNADERVRTSLLDTPLWSTPFQLLPRMAYQGKELERSLLWQSEFAAAMSVKPHFMVCTVVGDDTIDDLWSLLATVAAQSYPNVEVFVGASTANVRDEVRSLFDEYKVAGEVFLYSTFDPFIEASAHSDGDNGRPSADPFGGEPNRGGGYFDHVRSFLNQTIPDGERHIVVVQPDALLHPSTLFIAAKQIIKRSTDLMYANEVVLTDDLRSSVTFVRRSPVDKYTMLATNTVGNLFILSARAVDHLIESGENFVTTDGFRMWPLASELVARELRRGFIPLGLLHTREKSQHTSQLRRPAEGAETILKNELRIYSMRVGVPLQDIEFVDHDFGFYAIPRPAPSNGAIQVVIPYRNQSATTIDCLESLSHQENSWEFHVTLVDNNSETSERAAVEARAGELNFAKVTHLTDGGHFNFARLNNFGAFHGDEPFILFLNNDVEVTGAPTVRRLRDWCAISDVGAVGGLLTYPSGIIQHAGISFLSVRPANVSTDEHFAFLTREVNAVTFAMAMVKREAFRSVEGLSEFHCPNGFGDALFCLELRKKGFRSIFTPLATGVHHESLSRGRISEELELLEMTQAGLPITDLYADFYAELQPMRLPLVGSDSGNFDRLVHRIRRSPRLSRLAERVCRVLLFPVRMFLKI